MPPTSAWKQAIGARIRKARQERDINSQSKLARLLGVAPQTVQQWESGDTSPRSHHAHQLAELFSMPASWFMVVAEGTEPDAYTPAGPAKSVPLISWVQAGSWNPAEDPYAMGQGEDTVQTFQHVSEAAFALRVRGDSMEPTFPAGCIIVVDPLRDPKNGDFVIARLNEKDEATFKQLVVDGGVTYLKPVNSRYPVITVSEDAAICGVVCEMRMSF